MITFTRNGQAYTAERIEQRDGYFIAFAVTCGQKRFARILIRGTHPSGVSRAPIGCK